MIVEFVTFANPPGRSRAEELMAVREVVPKWAANRELIRKHFLWGLGPDEGAGGGLYIWPSIEAARRAHDDVWKAAVKARTGSDPVIRYFDLMALVDNERGVALEWDEKGEVGAIF